MTVLAPSAPTDPLGDIQSRVLLLQQRIASITGQVPTGGVLGADGLPTGTSATFASTLAEAQAQMTGADGTASGDEIVSDATKYLGVPYVWGGTDPDTGLDCSGFTQLVMRENGITVPRTAAQQATVGTEVPSLAQAQPGDLVVLEGGTHIGIYVGDGKMIHAPKAGDVVKVSKVWETPMTIRRLTGEATTGYSTGYGAGYSTGTSGATGLDTLSYLRSSLGLSSTSATSTSASTAGATSGTTSTSVSPYSSLFAAATDRYDLPAGLLSAVAQVESGGDAGAVSPAGAQGLMQLMPGTAASLGVNALDPAQAVDGAARLLSKHLRSYDGSVPLALAAYNAGPGNVAKYDGIPPFTETRNYVRKVTTLLNGSTS